MWTAPRIWPGETVFIIAGGPSVAHQNMAALEGRKVIAVNSSWRVAPFAQFCFFGDRRWWVENQTALGAFRGSLVTCAPNAYGDRLKKIAKKSMPPGLWTKPDGVIMGRTSLHGAMNLAFHFGAVRIVLLGADMQADGDRTHHHDPHPWPQNPGCWNLQMTTLKTIADPLREHGVEVINASPVSKIDWWPKADLAQCLTGKPVASS